jgi:hypothetical protein
MLDEDKSSSYQPTLGNETTATTVTECKCGMPLCICEAPKPTPIPIQVSVVADAISAPKWSNHIGCVIFFFFPSYANCRYRAPQPQLYKQTQDQRKLIMNWVQGNLQLHQVTAQGCYLHAR